MLVLSRDNSTVIKGIAILMMLFIHLFDYGNAALCVNLLHVGDTPLAAWLAGACNCVPYFLLLSGYGLACKYEQGKLEPKHQAERTLFLYLHYWIVLAVFLTIGHFIYPERYPGGLGTLIANMLGWHTTYNHEMWFLLPYVAISIASLGIIGLVERVDPYWSVGVTAVLNIVISLFINRNSALLNHNVALFQLLIFGQFLYYFVVGVFLRRTTIGLNRPMPQWAVISAMAVLTLLLCATKQYLLYMACAPLMVILFCHINYPRLLLSMLRELGRKSMPMWMIHTWLSSYLFQPQVYSLRYPLLIFIALVLVSYLLSIPVMWVTDKLWQTTTGLLSHRQ